LGDVSTFVLIEFDPSCPAAESMPRTFGEATQEAGGIPVPLAGRTGDDRAVVASAFVPALAALRVVLDLRATLVAADPTVRVALWTDDPAEAGTASRDHSLARALELLRASSAGQVLAGATTAVLVGPALPAHVELVDLGSRVLDRGRRSDRIYELAPADAGSAHRLAPHDGSGVAPASNLSWAHRAAPRPVAGREVPLADLEAAWRTTLKGKRRAVIVRGESGIGKTALAADVALKVHAAGAQVLYGRWDRERVSPYQAFREALGAYARDCPPGQLREQLDGHRAALRLLLPEVDAGLAARRPIGRGDPEGRRLELYGAVGAWLDLLAAERPVLVVLDDLHWAERSSLLLLDSLLHTASRAPWMLLATARTGSDTSSLAVDASAEPGVLEQMAASDGYDHIELRGLDAPTISGLAERTLGRPIAPDSSVVEALTADTAGNPLLVLQILRSIGDEADVEAALQEARRRLPNRLTDVVRWRLSQLPSRTRGLLADAAVIGPTIDVDLVASASGIPPVVVDQALQPAVREALLRPDVPDESYLFAHEVIRRALSDAVDPVRCELLHRRTAMALDARSAAEDGEAIAPTRIADHYLLGANRATVPAAVRWARRAAAAACDATGFDEAVHLLTRAVAVHDRLGDDPVVGCELRLELADAHDLAGQLTERDRRHREAADRARELDRTDLFVRAALGYGGQLPAAPFPDPTARQLVEEGLRRLPSDDGRERALVLGRLAHLRHLDAPYEVRRRLVDEAIAMARRLDDQRTLAMVLMDRCFALDSLPDTADNLGAGRDVAAIGEQLDQPDLRLQGLRVQASALLSEGRTEEAAALAAEHARLAAEVRHQDGLRLKAMWDIFWTVLQGRYAESEALVDRLVADLEQAGHPQAAFIGFAYTFVPRWLHGELERTRPTIQALRAQDTTSSAWWAISLWLDAYTGHRDRVRQELDERDPAEVIGRIDRNFLWWPTVAACALSASACGDRRWAAVLYDTIAPHGGCLGTAGYALFVGAIDHHLGTLALVLGQRTDAITHLRSGLASHRELDAPSFVALSAHELASALMTGTPTPEQCEEATALATEAAELQRRLGLAGLPDLAAVGDPPG
jgi:AAA ATPase domain